MPAYEYARGMACVVSGARHREVRARGGGAAPRGARLPPTTIGANLVLGEAAFQYVNVVVGLAVEYARAAGPS